MEQRLNYPRLAPEATRAMTALGSYLATCGLEHSLLELVKIRASQMNGCSFCIDMHTKDARAGGETEQRIYALNAWRETPFFLDKSVEPAGQWLKRTSGLARSCVCASPCAALLR